MRTNVTARSNSWVLRGSQGRLVPTLEPTLESTSQLGLAGSAEMNSVADITAEQTKSDPTAQLGLAVA